jgi:hypothetical protein
MRNPLDEALKSKSSVAKDRKTRARNAMKPKNPKLKAAAKDRARSMSSADRRAAAKKAAKTRVRRASVGIYDSVLKLVTSGKYTRADLLATITESLENTGAFFGDEETCDCTGDETCPVCEEPGSFQEAATPDCMCDWNKNESCAKCSSAYKEAKSKKQKIEMSENELLAHTLLDTPDEELLPIVAEYYRKRGMPETLAIKEANKHLIHMRNLDESQLINYITGFYKPQPTREIQIADNLYNLPDSDLVPVVTEYYVNMGLDRSIALSEARSDISNLRSLSKQDLELQVFDHFNKRK